MAKILVVDDDALLRQSVAFNLEQAGYQVQMASDARSALAQVEAEPPDLILLDIGLPDMDGLEVLRRLHERIPVIFVTARRRELDEVLGLELGAQDYITKPFSKDVLLARVRTVLRRNQAGIQTPTTTVSIGDLVVDPEAHTVTLHDELVSLSPLEFRLLYVFAQEPNRVFSTDELLARVWGETYAGEPQIIYVYIRGLRAKLEDDPQRPRRIVTVRGVGYKLTSQEL